MNNIFDRMSSPNESLPSSPSPSLSGHPEVESQSADLLDEFHPQAPPTLDAAHPRTAAEIRIAVQELLKFGYLEEGHRREVFRSILVREQAINQILEPLDLELRIDTHRGLAYLVVLKAWEEGNSENDAWAHPLVRKQRLTLEQSLLIAILRQSFIRHEQESGVGQSDARTSVEDLLPLYITYFGDTGSDAKNESKLLHLLDQLKAYGIVTEVDTKQELIIRPLIAHLANPESLATLLKVLQERSRIGEEVTPTVDGDEA